MIVLLDLNYTLVANSMELSRKGWEHRQKHERYRTWLLGLLRDMQPDAIVLITVRPRWQQEWTLANIAEKCDGWQPDLALFSPGGMSPPDWKRQAVHDLVVPRYGTPRGVGGDTTYLAVESNQDTHKMYWNDFKIRGLKAFPSTEFTDERRREPAARKADPALFD